MFHVFCNQRPQRRWFFLWGFPLLCLQLPFSPIAHSPQETSDLATPPEFARGEQTAVGERSQPLPGALESVLEPSLGDYLEQIQPSQRGYLLWTNWPVRFYLQPIEAPANSALGQRQAAWEMAAKGAIADWSAYLPLEQTSSPEQADIVIRRQQPPLRWQNGQLSPARHAETRFRITASRDGQGQPCWKHQQTIYVGDRQGPNQLRGTLRHELGHALGLWGHSPDPDDALYTSQVADPPAISVRDLNTLAKLYQQPTQLGCSEIGYSVGHPETVHGS